MLEKAAVGYQFEPGCNFTCGECVMLKDIVAGRNGCAWFGKNEIVSAATGSCNEFHRGDHERANIPWLGLSDKVSLGYAENKVGFGCRRCREFLPKDYACMKVDKNSPGQSPGEISRDGCCDEWSKDLKRGNMTNAQLLITLGAPKRVLSHTH